MVLPLLLCAAKASAEERTVIDMRNRPVVIPAQVTRAIGTGGAVDAWFLLLGGQDKPWRPRPHRQKPLVRQIPSPHSSTPDAHFLE